MNRAFFKYSFVLLVCFCTTRAWSDDLCNPVVEPMDNKTTIAQILAALAEKYNFVLSFPKSLDQPIQVNDRMELDRLIKMLTSGMSTVLRHEEVEGCAVLRLSELTVMPVGDESEFISVEKKPKAQPVAYIYIENMEQYVTEVLMRERKAKLKKMTPEQAAEFKLVRKRLRVELHDEIRQNKKKYRKKNKLKKTEKNSRKDDSGA